MSTGRLDAQIITFNAVGGVIGGPPQEPQPVSLPDHLMIPGRVPDSSVAEGEECAVCMEQAKGAKLEPCGHRDLCYGCAEHIRKHGGDCPMCRAKIQSVKKKR
uniref:RING-type domain-containing protein n=1 Tax=Hemiselmis andersenii TaxID=464988 RepID=A0A6U4LBZ0_HEMAN|mmetsp:Transcript_26623/g.61768  ORF Transcript_26623/g.61768 Transcript_26623/m.61768 type:complete len:103 (+) Transcript_26623:3-311(+)